MQEKGNAVVNLFTPHLIPLRAIPPFLYFVCLCFFVLISFIHVFSLLLSSSPLLHSTTSSAFLLFPLSGALFLPSVSLTRFIFWSNYSAHTCRSSQTHTQLSGMHFWLFTSQGHCGTAAKAGRVGKMDACMEVFVC